MLSNLVVEKSQTDILTITLEKGVLHWRTHSILTIFLQVKRQRERKRDKMTSDCRMHSCLRDASYWIGINWSTVKWKGLQKSSVFSALKFILQGKKNRKNLYMQSRNQFISSISNLSKVCPDGTAIKTMLPIKKPQFLFENVQCLVATTFVDS